MAYSAASPKCSKQILEKKVGAKAICHQSPAIEMDSIQCKVQCQGLDGEQLANLPVDTWGIKETCCHICLFKAVHGPSLESGTLHLLFLSLMFSLV